MPVTEFDDTSHYGFFTTGPTLTSQSGKYLRQSELVLAALRAQGVFDNLIDSETAPATDRLWLDKNSDPAILKEYDTVGSAWLPVTFDRLFGRAIITNLANVGGTANAITVDQPTAFFDNRLYALTPTADNTGAATIQVTGVGTYDVVYHDGSAVDAHEFVDGVNKLLLFTSGRFEVVTPFAAIYRAEAAAAAVIAAAAATDPRTYGIELTEIGVSGSTDQSANFNTMLAALATAGGGRVDMQGLQVRIDSTLNITGSNIVIENGGFDFSAAGNTDKLFEAKGTQGSSTSFPAHVRGVGSITVSDATGIAANDYLYLQSSEAFGVGGNKRGEIQRVKSVVGTTVGFWKRTRDDYTTTPIFYKPTFLRNVTFRNLVLIGKDHTDARQYAFDCELVENLTLDNIESRNFGDRHYQITNCIGFRISGADARGISHSTLVGLSYGVAVNEASEDGVIIACRFRDMKHGVTIGGETGVARHIKVTKCHASEIFDSSYDCHPQSQFITFEDCDCDNYSPIDSENGIVAQGANVKIINCRVFGSYVCGVLAQPACTSTAILDDHYEIRGCEIRDGYGAASIGVFLQNLRTSGELSFNIDGNTIFGLNSTTSAGIDVEVPADKGLVRGVGNSIDGNRILVRGTGIYVHTGLSGSGCSIQNLSVSDNKVRTSSTTAAVVLLASGQSGYIVTGNIQGNVLYGGNYGLLNSGSYAAHIATGGNVIRAYATGATSGTFVNAGTNYIS